MILLSSLIDNLLQHFLPSLKSFNIRAMLMLKRMNFSGFNFEYLLDFLFFGLNLSDLCWEAFGLFFEKDKFFDWDWDHLGLLFWGFLFLLFFYLLTLLCLLLLLWNLLLFLFLLLFLLHFDLYTLHRFTFHLWHFIPQLLNNFLQFWNFFTINFFLALQTICMTFILLHMCRIFLSFLLHFLVFHDFHL